MNRLVVEADYWRLGIGSLLLKLETSKNGLTSLEAKKRLKYYGHNEIANKSILPPFLTILISQFKNWLIIILILAAFVSFLFGERLDVVIVVLIVVATVIIGFFQEYRASISVEKLKKLISHRVKVKRDGNWVEIDSRELVVGDIVSFQIGDLIPGDIRLVSADNLLIDQSIITGESSPVVKKAVRVSSEKSRIDKLVNLAFAGTRVVGGCGEGIVVLTGSNTFIGKTANLLDTPEQPSEFQVEIKNLSVFLFRIMATMTIFVFFVNVYMVKGVLNSLLFAVALAVGIAPELLPAVVVIALSQGATQMAKKKVVVKRLISVEDLGNIDTICTDKTGTITEGKFKLVNYLNVIGEQDNTILVKSLVCTSNFIYGNRINSNPIDTAIWECKSAESLMVNLSNYKLLDVNEFDFTRRRMSVLVSDKKNRKENLLIVKGMPESVLAVAHLPAGDYQLISESIRAYEEKGFRVIALAEKRTNKTVTNKDDEVNLKFLGIILFEDPVKADAKEAIQLFQKLGVTVKVLSGDSQIITKNVAREVGFEVKNDDIVLGDSLEGLSDKEIEKYAVNYNFFARVTPEQKYRIVASLNKEGHVVGFLGDGVNDAPAIKAADVGIAVDSGSDIAKEAADIVLLKKDLAVLASGIEAGRKIFGNIMKYILNTVSANYGNMFTLTISSLFLKFIPLLPKQILLTNLISDVPLLGISTDNVDSDFTKKPKKWNIRLIARFMVYFGLISSFFDLILILPMTFAWKVPVEVFRTAWFVESTLSEILVTFSIRTKLPFYRSLPSSFLLYSSFLSSIVIVSLPNFGFGEKWFSFSRLPILIWIWIGIVLVGYFALTEAVKRIFFKRYEL